MPLVSSLSAVTIYQAFSQTITISAGTTGETFSSITVTKSPISTGGTGTSLAYQSLTLNGNNFISTDSLNFSYGAGTSQISFTLAGTYTDYMFNQTIKYYNNPNKNTAGIASTTNMPSIKISRTISNGDANPKINSYLNSKVSYQQVSTTNTRDQYYYTTNSWANVPNPVDAIYSFQPSTQGSINYFTYNFNIVGTGLTQSFNVNIPITQTINYDLGYETTQFLNTLSNQRYRGAT